MLSEADFALIKEYFVNLLQSVSVRTQNCVNMIGYQQFCVNYLFASESKLLKTKNFGRKSVYDFNTIRPSLTSYIIKCYNNSNTCNVELAIEAERKKIKQASLSLRDLIGDLKYNILNEEMFRMTTKLSVRVQNGISNYNGDFIEDFVHHSKDLKSLKNIGKKTEIEIAQVVHHLQEMVSSMKERELSSEEVFNIQHELIYGSCWDSFSCDFNMHYGHLPMFHIMENAINELLKIKNWQIFDLCLPLFNEHTADSLEEIAYKYNCSRERCRQICVKCSEQLHNLHNIGEEEKDDDIKQYFNRISRSKDWQYVIDSISNHDYISVRDVKVILCQENSSLSEELALLMVGSLVPSMYCPLGKRMMTLPTRAKQTWKNAYLVKRCLIEAFDFNIVKELLEEAEYNLEEDVRQNAEELVIDTLFSAWIKFDTNLVQSVSDVLYMILVQEFGMVPDDDFCFTLEGKKTKDTSNYIYQILPDKGEPMNIDDIFYALDKAYPSRYKSSSSIKAFVANDPRICMIGTKNLVGLIEWKHIKIGSIRDIIVQYLSEFADPQPLTDIIMYVQLYRKTSDNSIRSTMSSGNQFVSFEGALYGLRDKAYPAYYISSGSTKKHSPIE